MPRTNPAGRADKDAAKTTLCFYAARFVSVVRVMDSGASSCQKPFSGKLSHFPIQATNTSERNPFHL